MKYAIPLTNKRVSPHFGHCEQFAIIEVDESTKEITGKEMVTPPPHQPGVLPKWLAGYNVSAIIAGGMGLRARELFKSNNIDVITGATGIEPEKAARDYLQGTLQTGDNTCDHGNGHHTCNH